MAIKRKNSMMAKGSFHPECNKVFYSDDWLRSTNHTQCEQINWPNDHGNIDSREIQIRANVDSAGICTQNSGFPNPAKECTSCGASRVVSTLVHRLAGLVVKASASRAEDPGFECRLRRDFSGSSHTSDLKNGTPVATPAWRYWISAGTGRPGVSIL